MTKTELINSLVESCVECAPTGVWYVTPLWRQSPELADYDGDYAELLEVLQLTVEKKNAYDNTLKPTLDWLKALMTDGAESVLNETEIRLLNDMLDYKEASGADKKRKADFDGWSFAKR